MLRIFRTWSAPAWLALALAAAMSTALAQSGSWQQQQQQQQQWQRQQDQQRQQQQEQQRQQQQQAERQRMQDQQRQQMQQAERQRMQDQMRQQQQQQMRDQMQAQQRQQMQSQQRQQMQQQQQSQQRQQMQAQQQQQNQQRQQQQARAQGTLQPGTNKSNGMVVSGGVAKMNRPLTPGEIQRGFTGKVTSDGKALIKYQGRIFTVPASRVSGLSARLAANQNQKAQASRWTAQQKTDVSRRVQALAAGGGGGNGPDCGVPGKPPCGPGGTSVAPGLPGCTPAGSLKCQFNQAANPAQSRIDAAKLARASADSGVKPTVGMSGAAANMAHEFKKSSESPIGKKADWEPTREPNRELSRAREITLQTETRFVRVHGGGNQAGTWFAREDELRDPNGRPLTRAEIKDKFALKHLPEYVSDVTVPPGERLRVGTVKEQPGWGAGGGTQYELKIPNGTNGAKPPAEYFSNQRPLPQ